MPLALPAIGSPVTRYRADGQGSGGDVRAMAGLTPATATQPASVMRVRVAIERRF